MTAALEGARPGSTLPPGKTRYPFYRRLGGPQDRSGRAENLVPTWIRSRTVQPVAQSLYRLSYPAHTLNVYLLIFMTTLITFYRIYHGCSCCHYYQCLSVCCDYFCTVIAMVTRVTIVFRVTMAALVTEFTNLPAVSVATTVSKITKSSLYKGAGTALLCSHFSSSCHWWVGFNFPLLAAIYIFC